MKDVGIKSVIVFRHGIAVDIGERGVTRDGDRMLSEEGLIRTRQAARGLKAIGFQPDALISSPLRRAMETAEIIRMELGKKESVLQSDVLLPAAKPADTVPVLNATRGSAVILVGHMPHLSRLVSFLLKGDSTLHIPLKKASACLLGIEAGNVVPGRATLQWLLPPAVLRALGR